VTDSPNASLIGTPGSRWQLFTPALIVDLDALDANIAAMANWAAEVGVQLRPHGKSHKSPDIARRQVAAGAVGVCCASVREAEVMVAAGIPSVLITTALAPNKAARVAAIAGGVSEVGCVVDHVDQVDAYQKAAADAGVQLRLVVDLDVGHGRTGTPSPEDAVAIAGRIVAAEHLNYGGVQAYMGHLQHIYEVDARSRDLIPPTERLTGVIDALRQANLPPSIATGGGTGTHRLDAERGVLGELQVGSYVFMDVDYNAVAQATDGAMPFATALFVQTSVVNINHDAYAVTDAGLKSFATDGPKPIIARGAPAGASYRYMGDEHGAVQYAADGARLKLGDRVECVTPHCDPNANLFDHYHVVQGDDLVDIWPVAARGNP
jgi:3-hydroxy-D-aspartate aldolase